MADLAAYPGGVQSKPIHSLKLLLEWGEGGGALWQLTTQLKYVTLFLQSTVVDYCLSKDSGAMQNMIEE